jgi:hypothetical protein
MAFMCVDTHSIKKESERDAAHKGKEAEVVN